MYLHTSPEFAMKKLLAAGETRIHAFAHVWRNRERGPLHSPEFTMLEWYRVGDPYTRLMQDCADMLRLAAEAAGTRVLRYRDRVCDPFAEPERISLADAFTRYAQIDLLATVDGAGVPDAPALAAALVGAGLRVAPDDTWSDMLARVLVARVVVGLRPQHLTLTEGTTHRVDMAEALGGVSFIHLTAPGGEKLVVEARGDTPVRPGHRVGLTFDARAALYFAADSAGLRLR